MTMPLYQTRIYTGRSAEEIRAQRTRDAERLRGAGWETARKDVELASDRTITASVTYKRVGAPDPARRVHGEAALKLIIGTLVAIGAGVLSVMSYESAGPGERYIVLTGAIVVGAIVTWRSLGRLWVRDRYPDDLLPEREPGSMD
jgi:hypothetical protein